MISGANNKLCHRNMRRGVKIRQGYLDMFINYIMLHEYRPYTLSIGGRLRLKCDDTRGETKFRLSAKRTSPFTSAGASVRSTTGSRGVRISSSNTGYTMFRGSVKSTGYPHHSPVSPSLALPCVTVCHHISIGLYYHSGVLLEDDQAVLYSQVRSPSAEQNRPRGNNVVKKVHVALALRFFALTPLVHLHQCVIYGVSFSV